EEIFGATDEHAAAMARRMTMEGQLNSLQSKRKLIDRSAQILAAAQRQLSEYAAPPLPPDTAPLIDESRLLQAVVDTQEEERKRIARQVHDGPAQAMANVVLQSEISERLFDVDAQKSRGELASLRQMVNKTLQELRGFILELRPRPPAAVRRRGRDLPPDPGFARRTDRQGAGQGDRSRPSVEGRHARRAPAERRQGASA